MSASIHPLPLLCLLMLILAACGYTPPHPADTAKPSYQSDLGVCRESGDKEAHRLVMSQGGYFLSYPISTWFLDRREVRKCMVGKGYAANG
jgi:hypothetical protein